MILQPNDNGVTVKQKRAKNGKEKSPSNELKDMFPVSQSPTDIIEVEDLAFVGKTVEKSGSEDRVAEEFSPTLETFIGSNNNRSVFVELCDKAEE